MLLVYVFAVLLMAILEHAYLQRKKCAVKLLCEAVVVSFTGAGDCIS